ncbi:MAG: hypothetical protein IJL83_03755, partial [Clostridia bacterium]|nr:hypothetical protein [Clostridia bacterium]
MKRTKKVLTLLLCMLMLVGILPLGQRARAEEITNLSATITLPTAGAHPVFTGTPGDSTLYTIREVKFYDEDHMLTDADTFAEGKTYRVLVWFRPVYSGYEIPAGGTAVINGSYTAEYHSAVSDGYGTKIFKLFYKVPAPENTGTKLNKVTVSDIQVPVIWDNLDSSFSVAPEAAYKKESIYQTIRWSKKSGSYTYISCAEGEMVKAGEIYCATILLRSKDDRPFDGNHPITITANTLHGTDAVYHKVVDTQYTLRNDNMVIEIKLFFKACMVYDYTFCFTNAPGKTHGMPKHGERVWDYYDVVPITQESDINTGSLSWYKSGTTTYLYPQETFQTGQEYELYFYLVDGETAIIKPGTIIVYYDDATGLYFEGELVADTYNGECHAWMEPKFTPVDPVIHSVELVNFSPPEIDDTVGQHVTVWANTSAGYELVSQTWHNQQGNTLPNSSIFEPATSYYSQLTVRPLNDRSFDSNIDVTLKNHNGNTVAIDDVQLQSDGTLRIRTASFPLVGYADTVRIYDYVPPTVGRLAGWCYPKIGSSAPYEFNQLTWHNATDNVTMSDSDVFEAGKTYYLMFTVKAKPGYTLDSDTQVRITTQYSGNTVETHAPAYSSGVLICSTKSTVAKERITDRVKVHGYRDPVAGEISLD